MKTAIKTTNPSELCSSSRVHALQGSKTGPQTRIG